jgi:hypothetical protein
MRPKLSTPVVSGLFFVVSLGLAWHAWRQNSRLGQSLQALLQKQTALTARIHQAQDQVDARKKDQAELQARIKSLSGSKAPAATEDGSGSDALKRMSLATLVTSDPHLFDLYLRSFRFGLRRQYGAAYQALGLNAAQIDKLEELATAHEADNMDIHASAEAQGLTPADSGIAAMVQQSNQQERDAAAAIIGMNWQLIRVSTAARVQPLQSDVYNIALGAAYASQPMTSAQTAQLTQILANNSSSFQSGAQAVSKSVNWDAAVAQAASTLTPVQLQSMTTFASQAELKDLANQFNAAQTPVGK